MKVKFYRGKSDNISLEKTPFSDGSLYLTTDNGDLFADALVQDSQKRIRVGGIRVVCVSATLTSKGWDRDTKTQVLSVQGLGADQDAEVGLSMTADHAAREAARKAKLAPTAQGKESITITADGSLPTIDIPVTVTLYI